MSRDEADELLHDLENWLEAREKNERNAYNGSREAVDMHRDILITTIEALIK